MGIFSDNAQELYEYGYSIIPLRPKSKVPFFNDWSKYCHTLPTQDEIDLWIRKYPNHNIGLCLGPASGVIAFDLDTDDVKVKEIIESTIIKSPVMRWGKKGYVGFYKYDEQPSTSFEGLIDFLCAGKQVVLPPSIHPDTNKPYLWLSDNDLRSIDKDDLPEFSEAMFKELCGKIKLKMPHLVKSNKYGDMSGRNDYLKRFVACHFDKLDFEQLVRRVMFHDKQHHGKSCLFEDKKEYPQSTPIDAATKFVSSIARTIEAKQKTKKGKKIKQSKKQSFEDFKYFFEFHLRGAKKNALTGEALIKDGNEWRSVLNRIEILKSHASDEGFVDSKTLSHLERWINECLDSTLILEKPVEWDGHDYIDEVFKHLTFKNLSHEHAVELFKEWASGIFKRFKDPRHQNRFLIMKGGQGIGKDTLIQNLCDGLGMYFQNMTIDRNSKENYLMMSRLLVANVAEFDQTVGFQVSFLKDMITKDSATFRTPYARTPEHAFLHTSFVSTCNVDDILRDHTGNRRYMIFELDSIDWDYKKDISSQLCAQYKALASQDFKAHNNALDSMHDYIKRLTPDDIEDLIVEDWFDRLRLLSTKSEHHLKKKFRHAEVSPVINDLALHYKKTPNQVLRMLRRKNCSEKQGGTVFYFRS